MRNLLLSIACVIVSVSGQDCANIVSAGRVFARNQNVGNVTVSAVQDDSCAETAIDVTLSTDQKATDTFFVTLYYLDTNGRSRSTSKYVSRITDASNFGAYSARHLFQIGKSSQLSRITVVEIGPSLEYLF